MYAKVVSQSITIPGYKYLFSKASGKYNCLVMLLVLSFLICMSQIYGFRVPVIIEKDTGAIILNAIVDTGLAKCPFKLLVHTYSPVTWITTSLTTYSRLQGEGTPSQIIHDLTLAQVFTEEESSPPQCKINHAKREAEQEISFITYGEENYESKLEYHIYKDQKIILENQELATLELPLTLTIVDRITQIVPENQVRPLQQFSGVIGAAPAWMNPVNSLLCILGIGNIKIVKERIGQIVAFDIKMHEGSMVGIGQQLHPKATWPWVELPIHHKRGTRAPFHKYWTFDADAMIQYPENVPINPIFVKQLEMMIDTTTDIISLPVTLFDNLIPGALEDEYEKHQLLYEFIHLNLPKACDQIISLLPSITFRFQMPPPAPSQSLIIITVESSLLIKRETEDRTQCKSLLRPQADVDFDFWKVGLPFLYKVYVEFLLVGVSDQAVPVVKLFDKKIVFTR